MKICFNTYGANLKGIIKRMVFVNSRCELENICFQEVGSMKRIICSGKCKWYLFAGAFWCVVCIGISIGSLFIDYIGRLFFAPLMVYALIRCLYFFLSYKNKRIIFDGNDIFYFSVLNKKYNYFFDDIESVSYYFGGRAQIAGIKFRLKAKKIILTKEMDGFFLVEDFLKQMELL
jgi:hypothetical protein